MGDEEGERMAVTDGRTHMRQFQGEPAQIHSLLMKVIWEEVEVRRRAQLHTNTQTFISFVPHRKLDWEVLGNVDVEGSEELKIEDKEQKTVSRLTVTPSARPPRRTVTDTCHLPGTECYLSSAHW